MSGKGKGRLNATVYLQHEGNVVGFGPDSDDIPESVARQIGGHAWEGGENPYGDSAEGSSDGPPPKAGRGSSADAWADYAKANGVEVDEDASRDAIIEACEAAGVSVDSE